ncbi:hypothetical protein BIW11_10738 [Tropilaelaps mercedesae]|uniref:Uncharacterized protein n=1 Tax=Tropilaelaps mercedesae TaxID=418985 RepID=A0A1V9XES8_9ACAR|nr:hypothetical protein BIW11_10738 [Tropilaelaps mercedesae]
MSDIFEKTTNLDKYMHHLTMAVAPSVNCSLDDIDLNALKVSDALVDTACLDDAHVSGTLVSRYLLMT